MERLEWKIDTNFENDERWVLHNGGMVRVGRVMRFEYPSGIISYSGKTFAVYHDDNDQEFSTMKEAAQYVVAEYKAWLVRHQNSTGTDAK